MLMFKPHIFTLIVFFVTVIDVCVLCIELYVHLKKLQQIMLFLCKIFSSSEMTSSLNIKNHLKLCIEMFILLCKAFFI